MLTYAAMGRRLLPISLGVAVAALAVVLLIVDEEAVVDVETQNDPSARYAARLDTLQIGVGIGMMRTLFLRKNTAL
jgi:hypothetical protein